MPTLLLTSLVELDDERLLYRVSDVAAALDVSRSAVYELMASGALPSVKIDRTRLIRDSDLQEFVALPR